MHNFFTIVMGLAIILSVYVMNLSLLPCHSVRAVAIIVITFLLWVGIEELFLTIPLLLRIRPTLWYQLACMSAHSFRAPVFVSTRTCEFLPFHTKNKEMLSFALH